jgi:hypothetical protein
MQVSVILDKFKSMRIGLTRSFTVLMNVYNNCKTQESEDIQY